MDKNSEWKFWFLFGELYVADWILFSTARLALEIYTLYMSAFSITSINLNYTTIGCKITGWARRFPFKVSTSEASFEGKLVSVGSIKRWFTPDHFVIALNQQGMPQERRRCRKHFLLGMQMEQRDKKKYRRALMRSRSARHSLNHFRPFLPWRLS